MGHLNGSERPMPLGNGPLGTVLRGLRGALWARGASDLSDVELLDGFVQQREEGAFTALVNRHGPMVWGVCQRVLRHAQDAEDAFQATFLVLARKAASLTRPDLLPSWLYGVAYRIALRNKAMTAKRLARERLVYDRADAEPSENVAWKEIEPLLDRELSLLPKKYQNPIVLCDLEGRSRKEVAQQLGLAEGTLSSRLARGRDLLRRRLQRRGVTLTCGGLTLALAQNAAAAGVPPTLLAATARAGTLFGAGQTVAIGASAKAVILAEGAMKGLLLSKLKLVVFLVFGLLLAGGWVAWGRRGAASPTEPMALAPDGRPTEQANQTNKPRESRPAALDDEVEWDDPLSDRDVQPPPVKTPPPELHCHPHYKKHVNARGLTILASERVSDVALQEAARIVNGVLEGRDDLRQALIASRVRYLVTHATEKPPIQLPESRKPKGFWDKFRTIDARVHTCSEDNLLHPPENSYGARSILVRAVARSVYKQGLPRLDPDFPATLRDLRQRALAQRLWHGTPAAFSNGDYWANAVMAYFDANNLRVSPASGVSRLCTREDLLAYDPEIFELVDSVFEQNPWRYRPRDASATP